MTTAPVPLTRHRSTTPATERSGHDARSRCRSGLATLPKDDPPPFPLSLIVGVALTVRQRTVADRRAQAWQRITWCLERTTSADPAEAELGWDIYTTVTDSPLITRTEEDVLVAVADRSTRRALAHPPETEDADNQNEQEDPR